MSSLSPQVYNAENWGMVRFRNSNPLQCCCLENPHGQRSLADYSRWGHKRAGLKQLSTHAAHTMSHELWGLGQAWPCPVPGFAGGWNRVRPGTGASVPLTLGVDVKVVLTNLTVKINTILMQCVFFFLRKSKACSQVHDEQNISLLNKNKQEWHHSKSSWSLRQWEKSIIRTGF